MEITQSNTSKGAVASKNANMILLPWLILILTISLGLFVFNIFAPVYFYNSMNNTKVSAALNKNTNIKKLFRENKLSLFVFKCPAFGDYELNYESEGVKGLMNFSAHLYAGRGTDYCTDIVIKKDDKGNLLYFGDDQVGMPFNDFIDKLNFRVSELMPYVDEDLKEYFESQENLKSWR